MKSAHAALDPSVELSRDGRILVFACEDVLVTRLKGLQAAGADVNDGDSSRRTRTPCSSEPCRLPGMHHVLPSRLTVVAPGPRANSLMHHFMHWVQSCTHPSRS